VRYFRHQNTKLQFSVDCVMLW